MAWPPAIQFVCQVLGAERVLFAVYYPIESNEEAMRLSENTSISNAVKEKAFHSNAENIFKL